MEVILSSSILNKVPKLIDIQGQSYIISKNEEGIPILFSASCPHQNNVVSELHDTPWKCPSHDWTFNPKTGQSINAPQSCLTKIPIRLEENSLHVTIPDVENQINFPKYDTKIPPKITIVGSASLLIEWNGFNILTDPWIEGSAVFDSWINYPPSGISVSSLPKIDAIWISHEHSDHFNENTLSLIDKSTKIYVPDFDDCRLEKLVRKLGFKNITSMPSGKLFSLSDKINAVSFTSGSFWNDNILYLQLGGFTILNVNDAGFNWKIPKIIGKVDLVCSQFSPASGYPATWTHIDMSKKLELMKERNMGILKMMKQITNLCNADYLLPFANFNELYQPEHRKFVEIQPKNRLTSVLDFFKSEKVKIIDLLPGESWDGKENNFSRKTNREIFYDKEYLFTYLSEKFHFEKKNRTYLKFNLTHTEIEDYFKKFIASELTKKIGKYSIFMNLSSEDRTLNAFIKFENGEIIYEPKEEICDANMTMICPGSIIQDIIRKDLSWDEISSGYWSTFSRNPDIYNIALWQLFHAPWKARKNFSSIMELNFDTQNISIADIIEKYGNPALRTLEKFGLYCAGCEASMGEKIIDGCRLHGLSLKQTEDLIYEINTIIQNKNSN
jgi:CMP-N-acetylneuraminate monooxygenase